MKKRKGIEKEKIIEPTYREAEGKLEAVGTQGRNLYLIVGGKKVFCGDKQIIKVEVKKA